MAQRPRNSGFTLIEAIFLVVIVGIVGVGAGVGLQALAKVPSQTDDQMAINAECVNRMEQMRATAFTSLAAKATALSGTVTINAKTYTSKVTAVAADADGNGTTETDYDLVTVTVGSKSLTCYVMQP